MRGILHKPGMSLFDIVFRKDKYNKNIFKYHVDVEEEDEDVDEEVERQTKRSVKAGNWELGPQVIDIYM